MEQFHFTFFLYLKLVMSQPLFWGRLEWVYIWVNILALKKVVGLTKNKVVRSDSEFEESRSKYLP